MRSVWRRQPPPPGPPPKKRGGELVVWLPSLRRRGRGDPYKRRPPLLFLPGHVIRCLGLRLENCHREAEKCWMWESICTNVFRKWVCWTSRERFSSGGWNTLGRKWKISYASCNRGVGLRWRRLAAGGGSWIWRKGWG